MSAYGNQQPGDHRRKWDASEYERLAADRKASEKKSRQEKEDEANGKLPAIERELLKIRDYKVDLESKLGKSIVVTKTTPQSQAGGYFCNVCDCVVKDSINFLDHINGKKHQRNMGMSMKLERSSLDQVKQRMEMKKKQTEDKKKEPPTKDYDLQQRVKDLQEQEAKLMEYRKEKRKEKKRKHSEVDDDGGCDPDMAAMMGFSGFGNSKKK